MQKVMVLGLLGLCSLEDIKRKRLTIIYILMFGVGGVILHLLTPVCSIYSILCGMLLGIGMMLLSYVTGGSVGMGDGILLVVTGVYLGGNKNLELFLMGIFLSGLWSLWLLVLKRRKRKEEIAFVPFLLLSYAIMLFQGVWI